MTRPANLEPRSAASPPSVCLVILHHNGRDLLERFLPSLANSDYQPLAPLPGGGAVLMLEKSSSRGR